MGDHSDLNVKPGMFRNGRDALAKAGAWLLMTATIVGAFIVGLEISRRWG